LKCHNCGFNIRDDAKFCGNCGSPVGSLEKKDGNKSIFCKNCGAELSEGTVFCTRCGTSITDQTKSSFVLSDWGKRFIAWLIDIIILSFILGWITLPGYVLVPELRWVPFVDLGTKNLIYFLYWMFMEGIYGQSLGKMIMKIKVTKLDGRSVDLPHAAIESIGKAFLLPIDCIIGWLLYGDKNQRLFNYISETLVVDL